MLTRARTFIVVTILALLVWILAESQTLRIQSAAGQIRFETGSNTRVVRVNPTDPFRGTVELRLSGSAGRMDDLLEALRQPIAVNVDSESPSGTGLRVVNLRDALRLTPEFEQSGISLIEVNPRFVQVEVDELVQRDVPVRIELPDVEVQGAARAEPETVRFSLPRSISEALPVEEAYVRATVQPDQIANLPTGRPQRIASVRVVPSPALAEAWQARQSRAQVGVTLTLRSRTETEVLPTVPVQVRVAPTELLRFDISIPEEDRFLHDVTVRGPSTAIERMRNDPNLRPVAVIALSFEELERGLTAKDAIFVFPPGLDGLEATADDVNVSLSITRRIEPGTTGQPESE